MNIEKWQGMVTAVSPYSLPPGATVDQNNLQVRKPGQLTPRPGMSLIYQGNAGAVLSMYRATDGKNSNDRLVVCRVTTGEGGSTQSYVTLEHLTYSGTSWTRNAIFQATGDKTTRPSICQDRFGHIFAFFGNGIQPQTFRYGLDDAATPLGMAAPTVAPGVSPSGDGWFIERVDVLASGTSYYTPPTISVSGGSPDRNATLRAVVQAGAIVAIDVVDGGSNFKAVPTLTVSNEQIGSGFYARGVLVIDPAVYGFKETTVPTVGNAGAGATVGGSTTHHYGTSSTGKAIIAYRTTSTGDIQQVESVYNEITGLYTALIPLTADSGTSTGKGAYAKVQFSSSSSAYKVGSNTPAWASFASPDTRTSSTLSGATATYQSRRFGWLTSGNYFENIATPPDQGVASRFSYWCWANRDAFWGVGFTPNIWRFTKSQVRVKGVTPDDWLGNNQQINEWGSYYFPDYTNVSYKMLIGPCTADAMQNEANWQTFSSPVQFVTVSGTKYPYIDIPLQPAKKTSGASFSQSAATVFPTVRVYLAYCPDEWTVNNATPLSQNAYNYRFIPLSGQDRRANFSDTTPSGGSPNGTGLVGLHNGGQDTFLRWYGEGAAAGFPMPRPITDFRNSSASATVGVANSTCQMVNPGAQMEAGTAFAIRFEQYNAYDYRVQDTSTSLGWVASGPAESAKYRYYDSMQRRGGFGSGYTDFYFEANTADATGAAAALLRPGAIYGTPSVTVFGSGWTANGEAASVYLPTRNETAAAGTPGNWSTGASQRYYTFATEELVAASPQKTIGSVQIISGGQNYYREPTILFRGGGGYGLKVQSTQSEGRITSLAIIDGGDGFSGDTSLYTDVQPAKLMPILRGTMRGKYRCAYRFADYRETAVLGANITTTRGSKTATLSSTTGVKPGMQLTWRGPAPFTLLATSQASTSSIINLPTTDNVTVGISVTGFPTGVAAAGGRYITAVYPAVTVAASTASLSNAIGVTSATGIVIGMAVYGTGIPTGTYVTNIAGTVVTISQNATATGSPTLTFGPAAALSAATGVALNNYLSFGQPSIDHLVKIVSVSGSQVTLATPAGQTGTGPIRVRDMSQPITYSDFSPIIDVDASANGSGRAAKMVWSLAGVTPPARAQYIEFFRTSADQSLVFYRLDLYARCGDGTITLFGEDGISDEELFDPDRPAYAALPVVLPNGGVNAYRFGTARDDMAVAVSWSDRLWYGVSTSGKDPNTVFFSEYDEYESCPDVNELPIQSNLRTTDYLTALVPFGASLVAMQTSHSYTINFNTDPVVDAVVSLTAHRGCLSQTCWDIFDDQIYAADERGIYRMTRGGEVESLSEAIRDWFDEGRIWLGSPNLLYLRIDAKTGILRFFAMTGQVVGYPNVTLCYHISNKTWWTESWPNSLTCSCDYRVPSSNTTETIYGAFDGNIYELDGLTDVAYRDIASVTITNPGSGYTIPPNISISGNGSGARFRGVVQDGKLVDIVILRGGWNYGSTSDDGTFNSAVVLSITGGDGTGAAGTAYARPPSTGVDATTELPILSRATVPWSIKTGPMALINDDSRGGDAQIDRSVTVTYRPTETSNTVILREFFNNSAYPRNNAMPRDRGTGFVHQSPGAKTTLDMVSTQLPSGFATGLAKARFAGRSLTDMSSADRHVAVELSAVASSANAGDPTPSGALIYSIEVNGVQDGGQ